MQEKFGEVRTCSSEDMIVDRQTHRQTDTLITILRSPIGGVVSSTPLMQMSENMMSANALNIYTTASKYTVNLNDPL